MSTYQFVQLRSKQNPSLLDFPIVPLEALVLSVDNLSTRARICLLDENGKVPQANLSVEGLPGVYLTAMSSSPPGSPALGDKYFNTTDHKIHTAVQGGGGIEWNAGAAPQDTAIYALPGNTLYVKSVSGGVANLTPVGSTPQPQQLDWLPTVTGCRTPNTAYEAGDKAAYPGQPEWYMEATSAGTTSDVLPLWPLNPVSGSTVIYDGTVTWQLNQICALHRQASFEAEGTVRVWSDLSQRLPEDDNVYVPTVEAMKEWVRDYLRDHLENLVVVQCDCSGGGNPEGTLQYPAPTVTASIPNGTPTNQNVVLTATYHSSITQPKYSVDGEQTWQIYVDGVTVSANNTTVYFQGFDDRDNYSEVASYTVTNIDKTAPTATVAYSPSTWTNGNVTATVSFSQDTAEAGYHLYGDDIEPTSDWTLLTLTTVGNKKVGEVTITDNCIPAVAAVDAAGNQSGAIVFSNVTWIDRVAPVIGPAEYGIPGTHGTYYSYRDINIHATKESGAPIASYWFKLGGSASDETGWTKTNTSATSCSYRCTQNGTLYVRVYDAAGNYAAEDYVMDYINSSTPPVPTVSHSPTAATNGSVTVTATSNDASVVRMYYKLPGQSAYSYEDSNTVTKTVTQNGTCFFYVVNNAATQSGIVSHNITNIDTVPPTVLLDYDGESPLGQILVTATLANSENFPISLQFKRNEGDAWGTSYAYDPNAPLINNGWYRYYATDGVGNTGETIIHITNIIEQEERD